MGGRASSKAFAQRDMCFPRTKGPPRIFPTQGFLSLRVRVWLHPPAPEEDWKEVGLQEGHVPSPGRPSCTRW